MKHRQEALSAPLQVSPRGIIGIKNAKQRLERISRRFMFASSAAPMSSSAEFQYQSGIVFIEDFNEVYFGDCFPRSHCLFQCGCF
jgi:hypothetical protein